MTTNRSTKTNQHDHEWIRGVNLGGWFVLERFINPYFFALTDCHIKGDFRFFPQQIDAPPPTDPNYKLMNSKECTPIQPYPVD
jgi:glucan 1,3-beta-glucosidase